MKVLVTGGAGYIGSIVTEQLVENGHNVVVIDNLSQGHREAVHKDAIFINADLGNQSKLNATFRSHRFEAVVHLAAETRVAHSMSHPSETFKQNLVYGIDLLNVMLRYDVVNMVFSSTAAVYGSTTKIPIEEDDSVNPINPYGASKLMYEQILSWYAQAYEVNSISLRYFNAAGSSDRYGEMHNPETHLIPNIIKTALGQLDQMPIFGDDYETHDGTCVRDYVHVLDIADAHILALERLESIKGNEVYNLGTEKGYSISEVLQAAREVTCVDIPIKMHPRRSGDPAILIASAKLAKNKLGWEPKHMNIIDIVDSSWNWKKRHPKGY